MTEGDIREFVQGRLLHDGEDIWILDQELAYDNTASRIRLGPEAMFFLVSTRADSFASMQRCTDAGRPVGLDAG